MARAQTLTAQINKKVNKHSIWFILILIVLFGCDANYIYSDFRQTGTNGWNKDSIIDFQFSIADTISRYDIVLGTRNLENYPFSNLWLFVEIIAPDLTQLNDTIEYQLAQPNGLWLGTGTSGVYLNQYNYRSKVFFPLSGNYEIKIQHGMRDSNLKGLRDIGLTIKKN